MAVPYTPFSSKKKSGLSGWLAASLAFHGLTFLLIALTADFGSNRVGNQGFANDDSISLTWLPGQGVAKRGELDTVIEGEGSESDLSSQMTVHIPTTELAQPAFNVSETEPQAVFDAPPNGAMPLDTLTAGSFAADSDGREVLHNHKSLERTAQAPNASNRRVGSSGGRDDTNGEGTGNDPGNGASGAPNHNRIRFFGIESHAQRVVYVIDASDSMRKHRAMEIARTQLMQSLHGLDPSTLFQIVFFDLDAHPMELAGEKPKLVRATSTNLRLAERFVRGIQPETGTNRFAALTGAFKFAPEVIFLLTDADSPEINAQQLSDIRRMSKRKTTIHVIEFGIGADLSRDSFLKKLARQNHGTHEYRNLDRER